MTRIDPNHLVFILKLLLIERSVLVLGESSHLVTACTCALVELLKPFKWASNFMPLLPSHMLDFVSSPVPFLIGMVVKNIDHSLKIEKDDRVCEAMAVGLSIINLTSQSVHLTTEADIVTMIQGCPFPK